MARQPVFFIGHGSPMNAIEDNAYRRSWQTLGLQFGDRKKWPMPKAILAISAHWLTRVPVYTSEHHPRTIHDFGGFPKELFAQQYPATNSSWLQTELQKLGAIADVGEWGYDHGTWSVLLPMFPKADIPVVQLSLAAPFDASAHWQLGRSLMSLRAQGVLIVASGNVVHNLGMMRPMQKGQQYPWAEQFDLAIGKAIKTNSVTTLKNWENLPGAQMSHPSHEHFLPLLYAAAAAGDDHPEFFNDELFMGGISMRSVIWSAPVSH